MKVQFLFLCFLLCILLLSCHSEQAEKKVDTEFNMSSKIKIEQCTPEMVENLTVLGQVWGFFKYYHPVVAKGSYNWDFELFRIIPVILKASSKEERNRLLYRWGQSLGKFSKMRAKQSYEGRVKLEPDLDWIMNKVELGEELSALLTDVRCAKRNGENQYVSFFQNVGNPDFSGEEAYASLPVVDTGYRILALFRYWNMIEYFYPNRHLIGEDWHSILKEFVPLFINARDMDSYKLTSLLLIGRIHDTHAYLLNDPDTGSPGRMGIPGQMQFVENKLMVKEIESSYSEVCLKPGDVIIEVNGEPVDSMIIRLAPYYPASNNAAQLRNMASDLLKTNDSRLNIKFERDEIIREEIVPCVPWSRAKEEVFCYTPQNSSSFLTDNIGYIYFGTLKNKDIPAIMDKFKETRGLILDLRCYPPEFIVLFTLADYLLPEKKTFVQFSRGSILDPGLFTMTASTSVGRNNENYYKGKVVILVNEITQSRAEYTAMAFRTAPKVVVVGSTTAGADGDVSLICLPGNLQTWISGSGIYTPDGAETQRVGIIPDIEIMPTIKGVREGRDELIEKAIEIICN